MTTEVVRTELFVSRPGGVSSTLAPASVFMSEDVWLPDGNIVIVAEDIAFSVYRSTLKRCSTVFCDLIAGVQELEPVDLINGCPVLSLQDHPGDLRHVFLMLFCGTDYFYDKDEVQAVPFNILASLVRVSYAYNIKDIHNQALIRLAKYFPSDLRSWDDKATRACYVTMTCTAPIEVIKLARMTNTPSLLPTAFLLCCNLTSTVWRGTSEPVLSSLSDADQARIIAGRTTLMNARAHRFLSVMNAAPARGCHGACACRDAVSRILDVHLANGPREDTVAAGRALDQIYPLFWDERGHGSAGQAYADLCAACAAEARRADEHWRAETWRALPGYFGLRLRNWADCQ